MAKKIQEKVVIESGKTYLGVVEDNNDPERLARCRIRVVDVHDERDKEGKYLIKKEDLPWATPWKDLNGNATNLPDTGKVVIVVFENGKANNPEYVYAAHFNANLEKKLQGLSKEDYISMKSLLFDHKTQIYVNDSEGLKLDHKFNNINIKEKTIDVNLKDNFGKVNLGSAKSTQRAILGDNFTEWLDKFLELMLSNSAFIGNFAAPILASPELMTHIKLYQTIRDPKILSKNVYIVDNDYVDKLDRIADPTIGDNWESTVVQNDITKQENVNYTPTDGTSSSTFSPGMTPSNIATTTPPTKEVHPDVNVVIKLLNNKKYTLYTEKNKLNIVAVRKQLAQPEQPYTDEFVDTLYITYKNDADEWTIKKYVFSTVPGLEFTLTPEILDNISSRQTQIPLSLSGMVGNKISVKQFVTSIGEPGTRILVPSQYVDSFRLNDNFDGLESKQGAQFLTWIDGDLTTPYFQPKDMSKPNTEVVNIKIGRGFPGGKKVGNWSTMGEQCFSTADELQEFIELCKKHANTYENSFTYTIVTKADWENATIDSEANKADPTSDPKIVGKADSPKPPAQTADKPEPKPKELKNDTEVLAFQVWANKNGEKISTDGLWGNQTSGSWNKLGKKFLKYIGHVIDSDLRLVFARLFPYGGAQKLSDGSYQFVSNFNNQKYRIALYENKRFAMLSNTTNTVISKGGYDNGCCALTVTEGQYSGKTFKDENAWENIRKLV